MKIKRSIPARCMHVKGGEIELREFQGRLCLRIDMLDGRTKPSEVELTAQELEEFRNEINRFLGVRSDLQNVTPTVCCGRNAEEWRGLYIDLLNHHKRLSVNPINEVPEGDQEWWI